MGTQIIELTAAPRAVTGLPLWLVLGTDFPDGENYKAEVVVVSDPVDGDLFHGNHVHQIFKLKRSLGYVFIAASTTDPTLLYIQVVGSVDADIVRKFIQSCYTAGYGGEDE